MPAPRCAWERRAYVDAIFLTKRGAEPLDPRAGIFQNFRAGRLADAKMRRQAEGFAVAECSFLSSLPPSPPSSPAADSAPTAGAAPTAEAALAGAALPAGPALPADATPAALLAPLAALPPAPSEPAAVLTPPPLAVAR